jgi:diaminopimelate decarboxylase (EC 4.1.1.20)
MRLSPSLSIRDGHLCIGNEDCTLLAERYGTPLYVTDGNRVIDQYRSYYRALAGRYPKVRVLYAAKANGNLALLRILAKEGAGADVFSSGELRLAMKAGMRPEHILFNGNSKSKADLTLAVQCGVKISVDSLDELALLDSVAASEGRTVRIAFRVNPAIEVPTHPKIATGLRTSKFGIPAGEILGAYQAALSCEHVEPTGLHCHIGSQILDIEPFVREAEVLAHLAGKLTDLGVRLQFIDLGGGLGIPYRHATDPAPTPEEYASRVVPVFLREIAEIGIQPELWVEPGRYLVADSTVLLTRVNSVKEAHRRFVNVDAGFNLLVRPAMYDAYHEVMVANHGQDPLQNLCTIAGPICESGDILAEDRSLPVVRAGDLIALLDTGAYGFAMSSQYNARPRCAEVLVLGGTTTEIRRAETIEDLVSPMEDPDR